MTPNAVITSEGVKNTVSVVIEIACRAALTKRFSKVLKKTIRKWRQKERHVLVTEIKWVAVSSDETM